MIKYYPLWRASVLCLHLIVLSSFLLSYPTHAQYLQQEWGQRFEAQPPSAGDMGASVVDTEGNIYMTGFNEAEAAGNSRIITLKYSPAGELLWASLHQENHGLTSFKEKAYGIELDGNGGVYIIGLVSWRQDGSSTDSHMATILKLDAADGAQLWSTTYGRDRAFGGVAGLAVDRDGGVYVAGWANTTHYPDYVLARFNASNGNLVWEQQFDGAAGMGDRAYDVKVDNKGGVYVTGSSRERLSLYDDFKTPVPVYTIATVKYNTLDGSVAWVAKYEGKSIRGYREGRRMVLDETGVYVVGSSDDRDFIVALKYDLQSGEELWASTYTYSTREHEGRDIALDGQGGLYVAGMTVDALPNYTTLKLSASSGRLIWSQIYDGGYYGFDQVRSLAVTNQGEVYVTGVNTAPEGKLNFITVRYQGEDGTQVWASRFTGADAQDSGATKLHVGPEGQVYLTGTASYDNDQRSRNLFVARYEPTSGQVVWSKKYGPSGLNDLMGTAVVVDADGNTFVTGNSESSRGTKYVFVAKYDASGRELWRSHHQDVQGVSQSNYIALDQQGGVFVATAAGRLLKLHAGNGSLIWQASIVEDPSATALIKGLVLDGGGAVYVAGTEYNGSTGMKRTVLTAKYDAASGELHWRDRHYGLDGDAEGMSLALDGKGNLYVAGALYGDGGWSIEMVTIRYKSDSGQKLWVASQDGVSPIAVAVDGNGGIYVAGIRVGVNNITTVKYKESDGSQAWIAFYGEDDQRDVAQDILVDAAGGVYVAGMSQGYLTTIKYQAADGATVWSDRLEELGDWNFQGLETDNKGSIYLAGNVAPLADPNRRLVTLVKYSSETGSLLWSEHIDQFSDMDAPWVLDFALGSSGDLHLTGLNNPSSGEQAAFTAKFSQRDDCLPVTEQAIAGPVKLRAGTEGAMFELAGTGATAFEWAVEGPAPVAITGQGTQKVTATLPDAAGFYKVSANYGNDCARYEASHQLAVYNPDNRIVAAAGWLHSPLNSQLAFMQQEGRGYFALAVQYQNQTEQVQGQVTFLLQENDLHFRSTSLEPGRLIVFGQEANFKGSGTINGRGSYGFLVSLVNHALNLNNPNDRLRLMIWEEGSGKIVYDNQAGDEEEATALHRIGMGAMVLYDPRQPDLRAKTELEALGVTLPDAAPMASLLAYPTAFSGSTTISFSLATEEAFTLELYDMNGRLVRKIADGRAGAGRTYTFELDGEALPEGIYIARLVSGSGTQSVKLLKR